MKKLTRFMVAIVSGLGATATVFSSPNFQHRPIGTDLSRIRGDVERVGNTMRSTIRVENERISSRSKQAQKS